MNRYRILAVLILTLEGWTARELAKLFKVTTRTIRRYRLLAARLADEEQGAA